MPTNFTVTNFTVGEVREWGDKAVIATLTVVAVDVDKGTITLGVTDMPTRGYRCEACDKEFEVQQKITEPKLTKCETCGGELTSLVGPVSFKLKGGGWHNTEYGKRGPR